MKRCPNCFKDNPNDCKFCGACGTSLEGVPETQDGISQFACRMGSALGKQVERASAAIAAGAEKAGAAVKAAQERTQGASGPTAPSASFVPLDQPILHQEAGVPGGGWEKSMNPNDAASVQITSYPFFQQEDEKTIAVLGEQAAAADLEGTYRMPYAVLTQKRLYCKNEAGNFVVESSDLLSVKDGRRYLQKWSFVLAMIIPTWYSLLCLGQLFLNLGYSPSSPFWNIVSIACCACTYFFHVRKDAIKTMIAMIVTILSFFLIH